MKYLFLLFIPILFSCAKKEQEKVYLPSYSDKLLQEQEVPINLPQINNGDYFFVEDSTLYINVFFLNDSTIKFNDSVFRLKDTTTQYYYIRNVGGKDTKDFSPEAVAKSIEVYLKKTQNSPKKNEFNLFCDSALGYKTLSTFYHNIFMLSLDNVKSINLFGENNKYVSVNYSKGLALNDMPGCIMHRRGNVFEILLNKDNQLMIESEWDLSFNDISPKVKEYYTNPNMDENLPELVEVNKQVCQQQITLLSKLILDGDSSRINKLKEWQTKLLNVKMSGAYKTLPDRTFILLQLDMRNNYKSYLSLVDSVTSGVNELKNKFCLDRYGKLYSELNESLYHEYQIKKVIDDIFPNKINSEVYYPPIEILPIPVDLTR